MSAVTILIGGDGPDAPMRTFRVNGATVQDLGDAAPARGESVVLVLPGSEVQVRRLAIAARSDAQARSAARYMLEDSFAAPDADVHVAVGEAQDESGQRLVTAISSARLQSWLEACVARGADPVSVYADFTVWPTPEHTIDAVDIGALCMVSAGRAGGYAIEADIAPALFQKWRAQTAGDMRALRRHPALTPAWRDAALDMDVSIWTPEASPLLALARAAADPPDHAPDLRQGDFVRASNAGSPWGFWRAAIAFVLLAFLVQTGAQAVSAWRDARAAKATLELAERDLRAARPDIGRIVSLRAQVAAIRADIARSGAHPVLAVNAALVDTLKANPAVRLDEVRHAEPGRRVTLRISADAPEPLDAFGGALREKGVAAQLQARSPENGRYVADILAEAP